MVKNKLPKEEEFFFQGVYSPEIEEEVGNPKPKKTTTYSNISKPYPDASVTTLYTFVKCLNNGKFFGKLKIFYPIFKYECP